MPSETVVPVQELIDAFLQHAAHEYRRDALSYHFNFVAVKTAAGKAILDLPRDQQVQVVLDIVPRQVAAIADRNRCASSELSELLGALLRKKLPFTAADLERLVRTVGEIKHSGWWSAVSPGGILRAVEDFAASQGIPVSLSEALDRLAARLREHDDYADGRKILQRVENVLRQTQPPASGAEDPGSPSVLPWRRSTGVALTTDEAWTRALRASLGGLPAEPRAGWDALLGHCALASTSKPSKKWLQQAQELVSALGSSFAPVAGTTLAEVGKPGAIRPAPPNALGYVADPTQVHDTHADLLRGLVWCTSVVEDEGLTALVGATAEVCFKKLPGIGPRAPKIGNACLWALANRSSPTAVAELSRLKTRAKHASTRTQLEKAFGTAATKTGMAPADLEELAVPTCGLTAVGEGRRPVGDFTALLQITDGVHAEVSWLTPAGTTQRSVPAPVKTTFPDEVKVIKGMEKEIAKSLAAQRSRLEHLFLQQRSWTLADFRARYLDHPLMGTLARRLIWRFADGARVQAGIWHGGSLVDVTGQALDGLGDQTCVTLWHPLHAAVDEVKAWRDWLETHELRQPFKQAHRELYLLTDAERQTGAYSNRFAAHILKQHQFGALCHERGWRYALQGEWDGHNTPSLSLPQWGVRAEFWVEPIRERAPGPERSDLSHHAIFVYVATDQVRFCSLESPIPLALADVPPLVFSEVLRDVDLFVGVASVGNEETWTDGGLLGGYREYWRTFAFGELLPSAQTRREVLATLVPRLKIADRCTLGDRFLAVRGDLRTYKIHLGSGNILMAPDDQYLCIVPKQSAATIVGGKVYLPFEGDALLSIILSKALLLADDARIKDPTIRNQIEARVASPV